MAQRLPDTADTGHQFLTMMGDSFTENHQNISLINYQAQILDAGI